MFVLGFSDGFDVILSNKKIYVAGSRDVGSGSFQQLGALFCWGPRFLPSFFGLVLEFFFVI